MAPSQQNNAGCREPLVLLCTVITTLLAVLAFLGIQKYTDLGGPPKPRESQPGPPAGVSEFQSDAGGGNSTSRSRSSEGGSNSQRADRSSTNSPNTYGADSGRDTIIKQAPTPENIKFTVSLNPTNPYQAGILDITVFINGNQQGRMDTNLGAHKLTISGTGPGYYNYELKGVFYGVSNQGLTRLRDFYGKGSVYATDGSSFRVTINSADFSLSLSK